MLDTRLVNGGMKAARSFAHQLLADLDAKLWATTEDKTETADLRDYLIGAARAVESNLLNASVHMKAYQETRFAQDGEMQRRISSTGKPFPTGDPEPRHQEREAQLHAAAQGVYVSVGAVMDCLATVVAGIAGLRCDLRRVDFGMLLPKDVLDDSYPSTSSNRILRKSLAAPTDDLHEIQVNALRGLIAATTAAGPDGWLAWMLGMRNMIVHRERRTEFIAFNRTSRSSQFVVSRVAPADPGLSNMQGLRSSREYLDGTYITEDIQVTLRGALNSLSAAVVGTISVIERLWLNRRERPDLRVPVAEQWKPLVLTHTFAGYEPGSVTINAKENVLMMNPDDVSRLRAGRLLT